MGESKEIKQNLIPFSASFLTAMVKVLFLKRKLDTGCASSQLSDFPNIF